MMRACKGTQTCAPGRVGAGSDFQLGWMSMISWRAGGMSRCKHVAIRVMADTPIRSARDLGHVRKRKYHDLEKHPRAAVLALTAHHNAGGHIKAIVGRTAETPVALVTKATSFVAILGVAARVSLVLHRTQERCT
jgi:hypothetical protein